MKESARILLIEDDAALSASLVDILEDEGCQVTPLTRGDEGLARAQKEPFDLVFTDLRLPGLDGLTLVKELHTARPHLPIILMTAHGTTETAIEATKHGAYDYLLKPFEMAHMLEVVDKAVFSSRLMTEVAQGGPDSGPLPPGRDALVGNSRAMQEIYKELGRVAQKPVTVLIRGETGTGKELVARALYQHSNRHTRPFVAINCAAIPETLLESELFGHEKGAFTGADTRRIGRFEQADGGTLFLDEIGELSLSTQSKLLRVLQERTLQRIGGKESIPIDVRLIAATHRDLERAIEEKAFREDLFYRLNVVTITLPPLRQRRDDIPLLINYFLQRYGTEMGVDCPSVQPTAVELLQQQTWPGNVRQIENVIRKLLLAARGFSITRDDVTRTLEQDNRPGSATAQNKSIREFVAEHLAAASRGQREKALEEIVKTIEDETYTQAIQLAGNNQAKAARWLGVSRLTMRERLVALGLHRIADKDPTDDE